MRQLALFAAIGFAVVLTSCDRFANQPKLRGFVVPYGEELAYPLVPPPGTVATDDELAHPRRRSHWRCCGAARSGSRSIARRATAMTAAATA